MGFRWILSDPVTSETWTMNINPNTGGSLPLQKNISTYATTADDSQTVFYEGADAPQTVQISGTLLDEDQYNKMIYWYSKRRQIQLTDDLGRTMWVYFATWNPTRKWSFQHPWRHEWQATFYVIGRQGVVTL